MESLATLLTNPVVILVIGIVTVIGMIIVLRVNAFIALITAAMLVSLLSPGVAGREDRPGGRAPSATTAGKIGIVIAMAAVIGKCLMDSGAADRIVRSFLQSAGREAGLGGADGQRLRALRCRSSSTPSSTCWSRWPARSGGAPDKNYMLYVTAIATGGAITHTLVPPTPGPLRDGRARWGSTSA